MLELEYANSIACLILLACIMPVATLVSPRRHPLHAALILWVGIAFALQVVSPFEDWLPQTAWHTGLLHIAQAVAVVAWRRRILLFLRVEFGEDAAEHPLRRLSDIEPLGMDDLHGVHGKGP